MAKRTIAVPRPSFNVEAGDVRRGYDRGPVQRASRRQWHSDQGILGALDAETLMLRRTTGTPALAHAER